MRSALFGLLAVVLVGCAGDTGSRSGSPYCGSMEGAVGIICQGAPCPYPCCRDGVTTTCYIPVGYECNAVRGGCDAGPDALVDGAATDVGTSDEGADSDASAGNDP